MTRRWFAVLGLVLLNVFCVGAKAHDLDGMLEQAMKNSPTPAVAVLEMHDGKITEAVRGLRRGDQTDAAQLNDVWATGSDGKPMTVAMIARLVDRGVLSWSTPLKKMLPDLARSMRAEYREVTLVQLLSHHSGLPHDVRDPEFFAKFFKDQRPLTQQRLAYIGRALTDKPEVTPGTKFSYSNTGYVVAAVAAERATGSSYEDLMEHEVFRPLGMTSARFARTHDGQPLGHRHGQPVTADYKDADDGNPLMLAPAGAELHLSLRDWSKFCLDQLAGARGEGKLLRPESYRLMQTDRGDNAGVGWGVQATIGDRKGPVLTHAGSDGNWYAVVLLFPQEKSGVIIASNAGPDMGADTLDRNVLKTLLPGLAPAK